jgi:hypothetical protein
MFNLLEFAKKLGESELCLKSEDEELHIGQRDLTINNNQFIEYVIVPASNKKIEVYAPEGREYQRTVREDAEIYFFDDYLISFYTSKRMAEELTFHKIPPSKLELLCSHLKS